MNSTATNTIQLGPRDFLTADIHLGGAPWPYKLWFPKAKGDPVEQLREAVARTWDYQVAADSTILIVGDAIDLWAKDVEKELAFYAARPGKKILIPGNHDRPHPMHKWSDKTLEEAGWSDVFEIRDARDTMVDLGAYTVPACHYPHNEKQQASWSHVRADGGLPVLHGHSHSRKKSSRTADGVLQVNVGWPAWRKLASVPEVIEELQARWNV